MHICNLITTITFPAVVVMWVAPSPGLLRRLCVWGRVWGFCVGGCLWRYVQGGVYGCMCRECVQGVVGYMQGGVCVELDNHYYIPCGCCDVGCPQSRFVMGVCAGRCVQGVCVGGCMQGGVNGCVQVEFEESVCRGLCVGSVCRGVCVQNLSTSITIPPVVVM